MRRTERLYYESPSVDRVEAQVIGVEDADDGRARVLELDRTLFYPEGGGQPSDGGSIAGVELASAVEDGGRILHRLSGRLDARPGDSLSLALDRTRRKDHSTQHSAQHLLSAALLRLFGAATVSFHLGPSTSSIDVDGPLLGEEDLASAEGEVRRAIDADVAYAAHVCPPEDIAAFKLRKRPPEGQDQLRIIEIAGIDFTPCCGTHVSSAGELYPFRIVGNEKYKGMNRITFVAGRRAGADYDAQSLASRSAARAFGCSVSELPERAAKATMRLKELEVAAALQARRLAALEAELEELRLGGLPDPVVKSWADRDVDSVLESLKAFALRGPVAIGASIPALTALAVAPTAEARLGERLAALAKGLGGKGGGGPTTFRATFVDAASLASFMEAAARGLRGD